MAMIPALFIYLFKANLSLALFCAIYYAVLHRLTFLKGNRWFLMGGALCAVLLPLVPVDALLSKHEELQQAVIYYLPVIPVPKAVPATPLGWQIASVIFWMGITAMGTRFLIQLLSLRRLHRSAKRKELVGYQVYALQKQVSPFSFFYNIYLNPDLHAPQQLPGILRHESVHVRQWHSLDIMIGALVQIFAWFNPAAWLLQHAIRENLEFITDRTLLQEGIDRQQYQFSLLEVNGIPHATAIANNFNFSSLKNRIMMMNKKRSPQYQVLRYTIPVVAAAALLLSLNATRAALLPVKEKVMATVALMQPQAAQAVVVASHDTSITKKAALRKDTTFSITINDAENGVIHPTSSASVRFVSSQRVDTAGNTFAIGTENNTILVMDDNNAMQARDTAKTLNLVLVNGVATIAKDTTRNIIRIRTTGRVPATPPLYFVDGKEIDALDMQNISPDNIESISVLKDGTATAQYGPRAAGGVILIKLKSAK